MPVSLVKTASEAACRSIAAASSSGTDPGVGVVDLAAEQALGLVVVGRVGELLLPLLPLSVALARRCSRWSRSVFGSTQRQQGLQAERRVADQREVDRRAPADVLRRARRAGSRSSPSGRKSR